MNNFFDSLESRTFLSVSPYILEAPDETDSTAVVMSYNAGDASPALRTTRAAHDKTPPTATLQASPITNSGASSYTFSVTYSDPSNVKRSSIGKGDILVTGPGSFSTTAKFVSATPATDAASVTATYSITPPGGSWSPSADGTYTVTLRPKQVADKLGNINPKAVSIGTFAVNISQPVGVNQAPSFTKGANQTVNKNSGLQTVTNWATNISPGPAGESGQTVAFLVSTDNDALFSLKPAISPNGSLTYTPTAGATGVAHVTVRLQDNGGTANGGVDTSAPQTFTINIGQPAQIPSLVGTYNGSLVIPAVGHYKSAVLRITQQANDGSYSGTLTADGVVSVNVSGTVAANRSFTMSVVTPPNTNHPGGPIDGSGTGTLDSTGKQMTVSLVLNQAYSPRPPGNFV
jgi:hypothetical protein